MIKSITKLNDNSISVIKEVDAIPAKELPPVTYDYDFLLNQKESIQKQWDEMVAQKNKEIDDINTARKAELDEVVALLSEADKLEVVAKPIKVKETPVEQIKAMNP